MKTLTLEDLNLTPKEVEILITGARVILPEADPQEDETLPMPLTGEQKAGP